MKPSLPRLLDRIDAEVGLDAVRAWNDWLFTEWWQPHPERIVPCGITYLGDADAAAAEVVATIEAAGGAAVFIEADLSDVAEEVGSLDPAELGSLDEADLVITGEGAWDATSDLGKITGEILLRAGVAGVPALLVCGRAAGPIPPGVTVVGAEAEWLDPEDISRLVADALG